ncbi:MAG: response regulator transcription factor [Rubrivivax sp.]|jgi:DNA-binding NarL/FixJ family response regulator|nr:response regulator transcription factor [Rubrivivax sp.]
MTAALAPWPATDHAARVMLVEDHAMLRDGLRAVLESAGHHVVAEADEPLRALAAIGRAQPDIVVLDLKLGTASGLDLLAALAEAGLAARVIVLTMSAEPRHLREALRLGAGGYLLKGAPARELLAAIAAVRAGQRHVGAGVAERSDAARSGDDDAALLGTLSRREREIAALVVRGQSSSEIAQRLGLSPKTIDSYRSRLMAKAGVSDLPALVRFAIRAGLIDADER